MYSSPGGPSLILGLGEVLFYAGSGQAALVGADPQPLRGRLIEAVGPHRAASLPFRAVAGAPGAASAHRIDTGSSHVTSRRLVFQGSTQTRDNAFGKLLGFQHRRGETTFSVSSRQSR